jgi:hypothetical protein
MVFNGAAVFTCFAWPLSFPTWGDVEGLCYHLHRPTNCSKRERVQSLLKGIALSRHTVQTGVALYRLFERKRVKKIFSMI